MANAEGKLITREQLFEQIWEMPILQLANKYGITDVGLAKICKRMNIPRPPRGYWSKLKVGKPLPKPQLRPTAVSELDRVVITPTPAEFKQKAIAKPLEVIPVPEILVEPHTLTIKSRVALNRGKTNERGLISPRTKACLDILVSRACIERACRVMDTLLKALGARGYSVSIKEGNHPITVVVVDGEELEIGIDEKIRHSVHVRTTADDIRYRRTYQHPPRYDYFSTGLISLRLRNATYCGRQQWADGKRQKVENFLGAFISGLEIAAQQKKAQREERDRRHKLWEEEAERRREREHLAYIDGKKAEKLIADTNAWTQADRIRHYVMALENIGATTSDFTSWIIWAKGYADKIDPLCSIDEIVFTEEDQHNSLY